MACNPGMHQRCDYLPCTTVTICHRAGAKKDSIRFCAIPCSQAPLTHIFRGGYSPLFLAFRGAAAPPPRFLCRCTIHVHVESIFIINFTERHYSEQPHSHDSLFHELGSLVLCSASFLLSFHLCTKCTCTSTNIKTKIESIATAVSEH